MIPQQDGPQGGGGVVLLRLAHEVKAASPSSRPSPPLARSTGKWPQRRWVILTNRDPATNVRSWRRILHPRGWRGRVRDGGTDPFEQSDLRGLRNLVGEAVTHLIESQGPPL